MFAVILKWFHCLVIFIIIKLEYSFHYTFFVPLAFLSLLPSSVRSEELFALSPTNSVIIFPPNSSFSNPVTFLFLPHGNGLLIS